MDSRFESEYHTRVSDRKLKIFTRSFASREDFEFPVRYNSCDIHFLIDCPLNYVYLFLSLERSSHKLLS